MGTGIGAAISANKIKGCAWRYAMMSFMRMARAHNDSNVLALGPGRRNGLALRSLKPPTEGSGDVINNGLIK